MKRYFIVSSDGRPTEVKKDEYERQRNCHYLTCYTVGGDGKTNIDKLTEESEHEPFCTDH